MKRALKSLLRLPASTGILYQAHQLLAKFYVKQRSIFVIMELCNEDPTTHEILLSFVKNSVSKDSVDWKFRFSRS